MTLTPDYLTFVQRSWVYHWFPACLKTVYPMFQWQVSTLNVSPSEIVSSGVKLAASHSCCWVVPRQWSSWYLFFNRKDHTYLAGSHIWGESYIIIFEISSHVSSLDIVICEAPNSCGMDQQPERGISMLSWVPATPRTGACVCSAT